MFSYEADKMPTKATFIKNNAINLLKSYPKQGKTSKLRKQPVPHKQKLDDELVLYRSQANSVMGENYSVYLTFSTRPVSVTVEI